MVMLRGGVSMPSVGLGSSGGCHPDVDGSESTCGNYNATLEAIKVGFRSFHDALSYGNQAGLGAAVRASGLPRKEIFVMSMVPKYLMGYNETRAAVVASLAQLQVDYIDLMMVHHRAADAGEWPRMEPPMVAFPDNWARPGSPVTNGTKAVWGPPACALEDGSWLKCQDGTWKALTELKAAGKLRAIGVSNWMVPNLQRMKDLGQELPAVNQIEQHIGWHDDAMLEFCAANDILVQAATPLARSLPDLVQLGVNAVISAIATKYHKSPAQVSLRYLLEIGVSPIPSAHSAQFLTEDINIHDFKMTADEVKALGQIAVPCRGAPNMGLMKCWADPNSMMCTDSTTGRMFHCP